MEKAWKSHGKAMEKLPGKGKCWDKHSLIAGKGCGEPGITQGMGAFSWNFHPHGEFPELEDPWDQQVPSCSCRTSRNPTFVPTGKELRAPHEGNQGSFREWGHWDTQNHGIRNSLSLGINPSPNFLIQVYFLFSQVMLEVPSGATARIRRC